MILIFADPTDPVAADGARMLAARGIAVARWAAKSFPGPTRLAMRWDERGRRRKQVVLDGVRLDLAEVRAVWHRRMQAGCPAEITDQRMRDFAAIESERVLMELAADLEVPVVPAPWPVARDKQAKLMQLTVAGRLGFELPPTLVTNDPDELAAFHREHARIITKVLEHRALEDSRLTHDFICYTEPVTRRDRFAFGSAWLCPVFAQACVPKRVELRVTVVGDRVFAAAIDTHRAPRARFDSRRADRCVAHTAYALPFAVETRGRALVHELGLRYGALDLIVTPDGRHVFLEVNPGGEYHWIEKLTGLPITAAIVDLLTELHGGAHRRTA